MTKWTKPTNPKNFTPKIENSGHRLQWNKSAEHCYKTNRDCDSCNIFIFYGMRFNPNLEPDTCHMPYAVTVILDKRGEPLKQLTEEEYKRKETARKAAEAHRLRKRREKGK